MKVEQPRALWAYFLLGEQDLKSFAGSGELNTDDHPLLEYRAPLRLLRPADNSTPSAVFAARRQGPPQQLTPQDLLAVAQTLLRVGEVEESRLIARPLFERLREEPEIWLYAGEVNRALRKFDVAQTCYKTAVEKGGGAQAKAGLAIVAADTRDPQAERLLSDALAAGDSPLRGELFFKRARLMAYEKKWLEAQEAQMQGLAVSNGYLALEWAQYGDLCLRGGKGAEAQAAFDKALALDKYNYGAHRIMAEFFLAAGMYKESAQQFRFLVRYHPMRDPGLYPQAAEALRRAGDASQANRMLAKGQRLFPPTHPTNAPQ
jgi:tetratricopeptide (TPR) repeat protein